MTPPPADAQTYVEIRLARCSCVSSAEYLVIRFAVSTLGQPKARNTTECVCVCCRRPGALLYQGWVYCFNPEVILYTAIGWPLSECSENGFHGQSFGPLSSIHLQEVCHFEGDFSIRAWRTSRFSLLFILALISTNRTSLFQRLASKPNTDNEDTPIRKQTSPSISYV